MGWDKHIQSIILKPDLFDIDGVTVAELVE